MFVIRPVFWHFAWWLLLAPLLLLELRALENLREQLAVQSAGATQVIATVTDQRVNGTQSLIRYRFQTPGDSTWYSAADMLGRHDLWTPLDQSAAARAAHEGLVEVHYLSQNPWANQPVGRLGNPIVDGIGVWGLFLIIDLVWLLETSLIARNFVRCQVAAERGELLRARFWRSVPVPVAVGRHG